MIGGSFLWRTLRGLLVMSKSKGALLLLGLLTLSGCNLGGGNDCSVFVQRCNLHGSGGGTTKPTVQSIKITPPNPSLVAGTSTQLAATAIYSDNSHADVTTQVAWSASNTAVATVGGTDGKTLAVSAGSSVVTAMLNNLTSASITLTVTPAKLVSIAITPPTPRIALGTTQPFTAIGTYTDNSTQNLTSQVTWASAAASVATISNAAGSNGLATSVATGSTNVTATWGGITSTPISLAVTPATLVSIAITPPAPSIAPGTTQPFTATGTYTDNSIQNLTTQVTWASGTTSVATISNAAGSNGLATSVAAGSTSVRATWGGIVSTPVTLTVTPATLVSIAITPPAPSIALGTTQQFTATGTYTDNSTQDLTTQVTWASATVSVATISNAAGSNGLATSVAAGSTSVIATWGGITSIPVTLTVTPATLVSIAIAPPAPSIALGTTQQFTATGTYTDNSTQNLTTHVTWTSATPSVATISNAAGSNGLATSVATGSTSVTAMLGTVASHAVTLTVTPATLVSITVTSIRPKIPLGSTRPLTATGTYSDSSTQDLTTTATWVSNDPSILSISNAAGSQGQARGAAPGSASISAAVGSVTSPLLPLTVTIAQYAYVANYADGTVSQYTIDASGALSAMSPATIAAGTVPGGGPHSVTVDPTGRYAYVANTGDSVVMQYTIDTAGALSAMARRPRIRERASSPLLSIRPAAMPM
jgi:hypothetical protein